MPSQVVIIGGGFGGLEAAFSLKELLGPSVDITLIDRADYHTFIPSIHEMISGKLSARDIQVPFSAMLPLAGIRFLRDEVRAIDRQQRHVVTLDHELPYDFLVLAAGAENTFYGVPGADAHAHRFRTANDAAAIWQRLEALRAGGLVGTRIVLAGGGTEGVEVAGEVVDYLFANGADDDLREGRVAVEVIEGRDLLLPGFPGEARTAAQEVLRSIGVSVRTGARITEVGPDTVRFVSGEHQPYSLLVWSGGIRPAPLISETGLQQDNAGWLVVDRGMCSPDDPRVFAVGDAVSIQKDGETLPVLRLAYHAQDQAVVAALNIAAAIRGDTPHDYVPRQKPQLISIGRDHGLLVQNDRVLKGGWVNGLKKAVEKKHILSCLTRPVTSRLAPLVPGLHLYRRVRLRLPL